MNKRAPNANAYAERFVLSIKSECLWKMVFFGETSLRRAIAAYLEHYQTERPHPGLGNEKLESSSAPNVGEVRCTERLGGILTLRGYRAPSTRDRPRKRLRTRVD